MEKFFATTILIVAMTIVACNKFSKDNRDTMSSFDGKIQLIENNGIYSFYEDGKELPLNNADTEGVERLKKGLTILSEVIDGNVTNLSSTNIFEKEGNQTVMLNRKVKILRKSGKYSLIVDDKDVSLAGLSDEKIKVLWDGVEQVNDVFFPKEASDKLMKLGDILQSHFLKDNLIKGKYEIKINNNSMLVNNVEMPKEVKDKYVALCQDFENKEEIGYYASGDLDLEKQYSK
jgi:hypothetical protein